jgi:hypothetical protein
VFVRIATLFDGENALEVVQALERLRLSMNVFGYGGNCRYGFLSLAERDEIRRGIHEAHRGHLVDVDGNRLVLREARSTSPGWLVVHQLYCAPESPSTRASAPRQRRRLRPQSVLAFSGTSAYFITHLWYRHQLAEVAPELFRVNFDVEPKLKFMPQREPVRHKAERILRLRFGLAGNYDSVGVRALSARFVHGTSRTMHSAFDRVRNAAASSG